MFVLLRLMSAIFYQILYMSIIASIVGLVILLIQKIIDRRISPKCSYFIWFAFILILVFPISIPSRFSIYNFVNIVDVKIIENEYDNVIQRKDKGYTVYKEFEKNNIFFNINLKVIFADILLLISLLKILKTLISYKLLIYEFGNDEIFDEKVLKIFDDCKSELKIDKNIKLINQNNITSPAIFGVLNPKIMLTEIMILEDDTVLINIFLHELSHYKRKDNLINFIMMILNSLYWFNPIIKHIFQCIRKDIEYATDELAIKNMSSDEVRNYCDSIIEIAGKCSSKIGPVLAFSAGFKHIEKRIDLISLKEKFQKFSIIISIFTVILILVICLVFYPTSFGMISVPKLYFKTNEGNITEITYLDEMPDMKPNVIYLKSDAKLKLIVKNTEPNEFIYFYKANEEFNDEKATSIYNGEIIQFENGEYFYKFIIENKFGRTFNYMIKIIVE